MYDKKLVKIGRLTMLFAIIANFLPAVYVGVRYGEMPDIATIGKLWLLAASAYGISWIVQPIAYFATLGTAGSYIGWLAGSVGDIRLPAASMAQKVVGVEPGTHEGDVIGTIGTACSVFVSAGMITLFIAIGSYVVPNLPQFVTDSFNNILPALFGAIYVDIARKDIRAGVCGFIAGAAILFLGGKLGINNGILTVLIVLSGILINRVFFVMDKKKAAQNA